MRWEPAVVLWCVCVCLNVHLKHVQAQLMKSNPGFNDRFLEVKEKLNYSLNRNARESSDDIKMELVELWSEYSSVKSDVIRCRGHTMLISGDQVTKLSPKGMTVESILPIPLLFSHKNMRFFEYIEYQRLFYLLICYMNNQCLLFSSMELEFTYRQTISDSGVPIDAKFFVQSDFIFLIVLYQARDSYLSQTRLYRWHKTSLDDEEMEPEITSTARSLTVFSDQDNIIIVLACVGDEKFKYPSQVWMRDPTGSIVKVHNLPILRPLSITHFIQRNQHFLLVVEEGRQSSVYWWEGREFVLWVPVEEDLNQFKVSVNSVMGMPFMMFTQGTHLKIYFMTSVKLKKVYDQNIPLATSPYTIHSIKSINMYENKEIFMFIQGLDGNSQTHKYLFKVKLENFQIDRAEEPGRRQGGSLDLVLSSIDALREQGDSLAKLVSRVLLTNKPALTKTTLISGTAVVRNGNIGRLFDSKYKVFSEKQDVRKALENVEGEIDEFNEKLRSINDSQKRHLIYHKDVHIFRANINSLIASTVNGYIYKPESYLSLNRYQRLQDVHTKKLKVMWLALTSIGNSLINGLLLEDPKINVTLKTNGLEFKNLYTNKANHVRLGKLLNYEDYEDGQHNLSKSDDDTTLHLSSDTVIDDLYVDNVNDIRVKELLNTLYLPYVNTTINGDVTFKKGLRVDELVTKNLRNINNPVQLDPVQIPQMPLIPLTPLDPIQPVSIERLLHQYQQGPTGYSPQFYSPAYLHPYMYYPVNGKRYSRSTQENVRVLTSKVKILGNLKVNRITFKNSTMSTCNGPVPTNDLIEMFWTKSSSQELPKVVNFSRGMTSLYNSSGILSINGIKKSELYQTSYVNTLTKGITKNNDTASQKYERRDNKYQEMSNKVIKVKHLHTNYIDGVPASKVMSLDILKSGRLKITTENLVIKGDLLSNSMNNITLKKKLDSAVITDQDTQLDELKMEKLSVMNIKMLLNVTDQKKKGAYRLRGDLHLQSLNVSYVKNKPLRLHLVVNRTVKTVIRGKKTFSSQVQVKSNLKVKFINNKNFSNLLLRSKKQVVSGLVTIRNAKFSSLSNVSLINQMDPKQFIYIGNPMANISENIFFSSIYVDGNITAPFLDEGCQLPEVDSIGRVVFKEQVVATLLSVGTAQWLAPGGKLSHLFSSAVTTDINQTITGSVAFSRLVAKDVQVDTLKGRNMSFIYEDSLMIGKESQVITGKKHFTGTIKCQNIEVKKGARFSKLNDININAVDKRLVRLTSEDHSGTGRVSGKKTFMSGFSAFNLTCEGGLNGIRAEMLARDSGPTIPALVVRSLTVLEDLKVEIINGINMERFLHDIIYLNSNNHQIIGDSLLVKGNVTFKGSINTININNISTDEMVFRVKREKTTHIQGCKSFTTDLHLYPNLTIDYLNRKHLAKTYDNSIKIYQNITINGSLELFDVELSTVYANEYFAEKRKLEHLNKFLNP